MRDLIAILTLELAAVISLLLAWAARRRTKVPGAIPFAATMGGVAAWTLGVAFGMANHSRLGAAIGTDVSFVGVATVPAAWLAFALEYTGRGRWLSRRTLPWLVAPPVLAVLLVITNPVHSLMYRDVGSSLARHQVRGPGFWGLAAFCYLCSFLALVLLVERAVRSGPLYRRQAALILVSALVPWVANAFYLFVLDPAKHLDPTPFTFTVTGSLCAWGLFRYGLLDILPVARAAVIEHMTDALVVWNEQGRVVDLNPAATRLFRLAAAQTIGLPLEEAFAPWPALLGHLRAATPQPEVTLAVTDPARHFDLQFFGVTDKQGNPVARVAVLRDITEQKLASLERQTLIQELQTALANVNTLSELLPICAGCKKIRDDRGYWNQVETYLQQRSRFRFSHGLCPECARKYFPGTEPSEEP